MKGLICLVRSHVALRLPEMNREPLMTIFSITDEEPLLVVELCARCGVLYWRPVDDDELIELTSRRDAGMVVEVSEEEWQKPLTA